MNKSYLNGEFWPCWLPKGESMFQYGKVNTKTINKNLLFGCDITMFSFFSSNQSIGARNNFRYFLVKEDCWVENRQSTESSIWIVYEICSAFSVFSLAQIGRKNLVHRIFWFISPLKSTGFPPKFSSGKTSAIDLPFLPGLKSLKWTMTTGMVMPGRGWILYTPSGDVSPAQLYHSLGSNWCADKTGLERQVYGGFNIQWCPSEASKKWGNAFRKPF